ncbi:hypothetical protein RclHR1_13650004 [Rhizophagus clarus]|uniref:Endonuclease/exonuclease/phosphatase domain-containing protein n=1 Tax=Rhizophagus clarus TaxID=94130 RepID=A0A2Z6QAN8_9GLOM|nr:hypothetical protein RclHR1_13650004 [Rhizophagus clarus]
MMSQQTIISPSIDGIMDIKNTFKISTLNTSGLNTTIKQEHLINFMNILNDIKILGVTETKLSINIGQHLYKNHKNYKAWWYSQALTLFLKGKIRFMIIVIYNYANNTIKKEITELYAYVKNLIKEEIKHKARIIIMGDFNASYDDYQQEIKICFIRILYQHGIVKIFKSRIDFIYVNYEIIPDLIYALTNKPHIVSTDYSIVTAYFSYDNIFRIKAVAIAKRHNTSYTNDYKRYDYINSKLAIITDLSYRLNIDKPNILALSILEFKQFVKDLFNIVTIRFKKEDENYKTERIKFFIDK